MFSAELGTGLLRDGGFAKRSDTVVEVCTMGSVVMVSGFAASVGKLNIFFYQIKFYIPPRRI